MPFNVIFLNEKLHFKYLEDLYVSGVPLIFIMFSAVLGVLETELNIV